MTMHRKYKIEELAKRTPESLAKSLAEAREKIEKLTLEVCGAHRNENHARFETDRAKEEAACLAKVNKAMAKVLRKNGIAPTELIIRRVAKVCPSSCSENCTMDWDDGGRECDEDDYGEENCPEKKLAEETSTAEFYCFSVCDGELEGVDENFDNIFEDGVFQVIDKKTMKIIYAGLTEDDLEEEDKEEEQADD